MSDEEQPVNAKHVFLKIAWRSTISLSGPMDQATTWSLTGIAAILGLLISNLDSVSKLVTPDGLRWCLWLFTGSLVAGALSKQLGMAVVSGVEMLQKFEGLLQSPQGQELMNAIEAPASQLVNEMAQPFWWPLSALMRKGGELGMRDYLSSDKRMVRLFCWQLLFVYAHGGLAAAGLLAVATHVQS